jgi:hypothetical protein
VEAGFGDGNTADEEIGEVYKNELLSFLICKLFQFNLRILRIHSIKSNSHQTTYEMATLAGKPITGNGLGLMSKSD